MKKGDWLALAVAISSAIGAWNAGYGLGRDRAVAEYKCWEDCDFMASKGRMEGDDCLCVAFEDDSFTFRAWVSKEE